ncbi:DUF3987 domain-containing protein [Parabacteroides sp. FAFU027]|uniref:DUF3987 domain-containing protein n=1 Tax=Parabacteroides sp. FAFU027 TaxID=2922715 RepID=UPI001FAF69CB|nr:DUF3987 domain-containing protein [Parabacteroides sp. FAFU027]
MTKTSLSAPVEMNPGLKTIAESVKNSSEGIIVPIGFTSPKSELSSKGKVSEMEENSENQNETLGSSLAQKKDDQEISETDSSTKVALPAFPGECYEDLPSMLGKAVSKGHSPEDKDILLLGSIVTLSACLPNLSGTYDQREVFPNLFLFVTAKASAGKGRLALCRKLVDSIHKELLQRQRQEKAQYKELMQQFRAANRGGSDAGRPQEPPLRALVVPANSSATSVFQILNDNDGVGLMFETEGDTLAQAFNSEHGNYSDGFRKAFHHETISYSRRKDNEFVELDKPRLSAVLSGTPRQVSTLIPSAENGLFSRFIYYYMNIRPEWINVFAGNDNQNLDKYFDDLGSQFYAFYNQLKEATPLHFRLSEQQQDEFNSFFSDMQIKLHCMLGDEYLASVRRLGLISFRIAMILTALRVMDKGNMKEPLICSDVDFKTAMAMVRVLIEHASYVFSQLPEERACVGKGKNKKQLFFDALPDTFNRKIYLEVADKLTLNPKTAEKYIADFKKSGLLKHDEHNKYSK